VESAYGEAVADIFLLAVPLALLSIIAIALLPNRALGTKTSQEQIADLEQTVVTVSAAEIAGESTEKIRDDEDARPHAPRHAEEAPERR